MVRMMPLKSLALVALTTSLPHLASALALLGNAGDAPAAVANTVVRVGAGSGTTWRSRGTGVVVGLKRDVTGNAGWLVVLTVDHAVKIADANPTDLWGIGFGNQPNSPVFAPSLSSANQQFVTYRYSGQPAGQNPVDLGVIGVRIADVTTLAAMSIAALGEAAADDDVIMFGYGLRANVVQAARAYVPISDTYGTLRQGKHKVGTLENSTHELSSSPTGSYTQASLRYRMSMTPASGTVTAATPHFLNGDSGGPTFKKVGEDYKLVGIHVSSGSDSTGAVFENFSSYDANVHTYRTWINGRIEAVPEPASITALGVGALALLRRRRR